MCCLLHRQHDSDLYQVLLLSCLQAAHSQATHLERPLTGICAAAVPPVQPDKRAIAVATLESAKPACHLSYQASNQVTDQQQVSVCWFLGPTSCTTHGPILHHDSSLSLSFQSMFGHLMSDVCKYRECVMSSDVTCMECVVTPKLPICCRTSEA